MRLMVRARGPCASSGWDSRRLALTAIVVQLVFALLLAHLQEKLQLTKPWVDAVLHQVMPIVSPLTGYSTRPTSACRFARRWYGWCSRSPGPSTPAA